MNFVPAFAFGFLVLTIGARVFSRPFCLVRPCSPDIARKFFWTGVLGVVAVLTIMSHVQFEAWANGDFVTQHLVPPLGGHRYFLFYVWWRFWAPYAISFLVAWIFFWLARFYNGSPSTRLAEDGESRRAGSGTIYWRHDGGFFYDEEYYFIALGIFLTGQPGWIFYLLAMTIIALCVHAGIAAARFAGALARRAGRLAMTEERYRFSFRHFWLPLAAFVILIMQWLAELPLFAMLKP